MRRFRGRGVGDRLLLCALLGLGLRCRLGFLRFLGFLRGADSSDQEALGVRVRRFTFFWRRGCGVGEALAVSESDGPAEYCRFERVLDALDLGLL